MPRLDCPGKKYILFDLDGTLLPMDMSRYIALYFDGLSKAMSDLPAEAVRRVLWEGIYAMMKNDGSKTNRACFAEVFMARTGIDYYAREDAFYRFYEEGYQNCVAACAPTPLAGQIVSALQKKGYGVVIATSPLYPPVATYSRIAWAGLKDFHFPLVTTFVDFCYAKPNPRYFAEVCEKLGVSPQECIMVGNDVEEDGAAREIGMDVILVTDCLINNKNLPLEGFCQATLAEVLRWAQELP